MALIKCPECGKEISEYAKECNSCGCPMDKIKQLIGFQQVVPAKTEERKEKNNFLSKISKEQNEFIINIMGSLSRDYEGESIIATSETDDGFSIECSKKKNVKCLFRVKDNMLLIYYINEKGFIRDDLIIAEYNSSFRAKTMRIIEKMLRENEPEIYNKKQEEKGSTKDKHYYRIFPSIKKEMNDKFYDATNKEKQLCKDLRKFLLDVLSMDSPKQLVSPTFACSHHTFFGHQLRWDTSDGYRSTAIVYFYYKASKIVDMVRKYERTMNTNIVENNGYQRLLDSLYRQFDNKKNIDLSSCDGITSNVCFIPDDAVVGVLKQFEEFEKNPS